MRWPASAAVAGLALVTVLLSPGAVSPAAEWEPGRGCEYVEAGAPGPRGNVLRLNEPSGPIGLRGERIVITEAFERCRGRQPTVHNIDRIVGRFPYEGPSFEEGVERFAPGATPERSGSEIEILLSGETFEIDRGAGPDATLVKTLDSGQIGLNLNPHADGDRRDIDIRMESEDPKLVRVRGEGGGDLIDARGLLGMGDNEYLSSRVRLEGGRGDDVILGSPGDEYRLTAGPGDDLVRSGGGDDDVEVGSGRDTVYGGPGDDLLYYLSFGTVRRPRSASDRLYGGRGDDLLSDVNGHPDLLLCGPGEDELDPERRDDRDPDCERLRGLG